MASATVFQSQFCKNLFSPFINPSTPSAVLFNGTDGNIFKWVDRRKPRGKIAVLAASWSSNLRKGHGELKKLSSLPSVEVTYVGRWPMDLNPGNIRILSPIPQQDLANLMTRFHIFAHFSDRDTSPNIVVEALATGLPVLYKHSGGTPEIVEEQRFGESIENNAKLQEERMTTALENLILRYDDIISEIKKERNRFLIETTARCYSHIFHTTAGDKLC
ncbi:MAG: glycosyltransferase [Elusimicrobia bacterium]|nr:glycosyltransferase [Candidatus Obscuribacterium magneticum]